MNVLDLIKEGVALFKNKKFDEAIEKLNQALDEIKDKDSQIQEQNYIQFYLGCCYFEQALKAKGKESEQLFEHAVEHFQQSLEFAKQLEDKQNSIEQQVYAQSWLGRCYLEQAMKAEGKEAAKLFERVVEHFQQQLRLAKQLEDKQNSLQEQNNAQYWLGRCYLEQAKKAKGKESEQLFEHAVEHFQQSLEFAKQLEDKQDSLQEQINAQSWLGGCYLEQVKKAKGKESEQLFGNAVEHHQQQLRLAEQLEDKQNSLQQQIYAQFGLGRCYLEQAKKAKGKESEQLFEQAVEHFQQSLEFAKQLEDKQNSLQEQIEAQLLLARCYFEQAMKAQGKESEQLFEQAVKHHQQQLRLAEQLEDKQNSLQEQFYAQFWLGYIYLKQAVKIKDEDSSKVKELTEKADKYFLFSLNNLPQLKDELERNRADRIIHQHLREILFLQEEWQSYFKQKKQEMKEKLFINEEDKLTNTISTILAVLNIPPIELGAIPLSHYTSPSVCERLFGIVSDKTNDKADNNDPVDSNNVSPMRIGSSTYMNDPTEGEGLLELLNLQDLELENKADCPVHNAFFTCFSSRVNDLNQFRLYGKENGVEASGCCLVFNKSGDWLKEPDISASFGSFTNKLNEDFKESVETDGADSEDENLPLYQVAYIAYQDEYIAEEKCGKWLLNKNNQSFGIRLKPIGKNPSWHQFRIDKLEEALMELIKKSNNISDEDKKALEYIRYLFKDFAFRDEEEFRLLKIEQIGSDKIKYCETTKSVYLPYTDICDIVDEVILGTNYEKSGNHRKTEVFQHLMRKHYPNVKVSRSSLPINANPPIKKD
ncbi:sel1 repeat family protein [Neisseria elongata]|uniref:SEL1-like repeat protein n=1 Tax=Neisseria elongata TaxID=495 RepID=UPI0028EA6D6A|nr:sel1 repeat family protein [Neisseria elongata]